jgi:hypothetical protein
MLGLVKEGNGCAGGPTAAERVVHPRMVGQRAGIANILGC